MCFAAIGRALTRARQETWLLWRTRKPLDRSLWALSSLDGADRELLTAQVRLDQGMRMTAEIDLEHLPRPQRVAYVRTLVRYMSTPGAPQGERSCDRALQRAAPDRWALYGAAGATIGEPEGQRLEIAMAELERRRAQIEKARRSHRLD